jgi:hypothetical protein
MFAAPDITETLANVLKLEPEWSHLPKGVSPYLQFLIRQCVAKDPKRRLRDVGDARMQLETLGSSEFEASVKPQEQSQPRSIGEWAWIAMSGAAVVVLAAVLGWYARGGSVSPAVRFTLTAPSGWTFALGGGIFGGAADFAVSPDGRRIAFAATNEGGKTQLWLRSLDSVNAEPLSATDNAAYPFWSPDSRFIAYTSGRTLLKVAATGGPPQTIATLNGEGAGGSWGSHDTIALSVGARRALMTLPAGGGQPHLLIPENATQPSFLPDGGHVLFHRDTTDTDVAGLYVAKLDGGDPIRLGAADSGAQYVPNAKGQLIFVLRVPSLHRRSILNVSG